MAEITTTFKFKNEFIINFAIRFILTIKISYIKHIVNVSGIADLNT